MTRPIVPIADMHRRLPELGRIRTGEKTAKAMRALSTFRFTSSDKTALDQIAGHYGGTVKPWSDAKVAEGQYEVVTDAAEIQVALPPDPLGGTPVYELWSGGGCERRCNGVTCESWVKGPEGPEITDQPCLCDAAGTMVCDPKTRLSVILPNVRGIGTWRLETKSWNAAVELPGMVDLIQSLQAKGITRATLRLEHKRSVRAGDTRKFIVPVLGLDESVEALVAGDAAIGRLAASTPAVAQIEAGGGEAPEAIGNAAPPASASLNDQIVAKREVIVPDLVDDDDLWTRHNPKARALADKAWPGDPHARDDNWHKTISALTDGRTDSSKQLTAEEWAQLIALLEELQPDAEPELSGPEKTKVLREARRLAPDAPPAAFTEIDPGLLALAMGVLDS
jgi:hypothetical protein